MMTLDECIKYVESHLEVRMATKSGAYRSGKTINITGCVNHSLGVAQPSVDVIYGNMNRTDGDACVHAILGDFDKGEGRILQILDWNMRPWGCGSGSKGSYNASRVQWEVCEPAGHTYKGGTMIGYDVKKNQAYFDRMWKMLVTWNVYCAHKFGYSVDCISDHSESHAAGYASNHADIMHWLPKHGKSMSLLRTEVKEILEGKNQGSEPESLDNLQATDLIGLSEKQVVDKVGPLFTADEKRCGILACVTFAQWILESGYGSTELAKKANNFFGMKEVLSGNTWAGSTWDGKSTVTINTKECYNGTWTTISAKFRKYPSVKESLADHSAYLLGALNGSNPRYQGLKGCKDYKKAAKIIKSGGYATDLNYVDKLVDIIGRWGLTKYNYSGEVDPSPAPNPSNSYPETPFGVKVLVEDLSIVPSSKENVPIGYTGIGAFTIVKVVDGFGLLKSYEKNEDGWIDLRDATKCKIMDSVPSDQKPSSGVPFMVHVDTNGLRIRKGPSMYSEFTGKYTGIGSFTIVDVQSGHGSENGWGLLKSYEAKRDGWIALDYTTKV